jgi:hypothetical protein
MLGPMLNPCSVLYVAKEEKEHTDCAPCYHERWKDESESIAFGEELDWKFAD